jgi:hypothetical protein
VNSEDLNLISFPTVAGAYARATRYSRQPVADFAYFVAVTVQTDVVKSSAFVASRPNCTSMPAT